MSEQLHEELTITDEDTNENAREYWKEKAQLLGISFAPNMPTPKLKDLVQNTIAEREANKPAGTKGKVTAERLAPEVLSAQDSAMALVRFKITVLDPNKSSLSGMTFTVANDNISPIRRTIPFNTEVWHAERIIVDYMKGMKYQVLKSQYNKNLRANFDDYQAAKQMPCFHIEELPPLTQEELASLAEIQTAQGTGRMEDNLK